MLSQQYHANPLLVFKSGSGGGTKTRVRQKQLELQTLCTSKLFNQKGWSMNYDDRANDRADKHAILMQYINKRKAPALLDKNLRKERITKARWRSVWIGANTFGLMLIVYMIYIFFIKG